MKWRSRAVLPLLVLVALGVSALPSCTPEPSRRDARAAAAQPIASKVILAATSGDYPPLSLWSEERPAGFAPALLDGFGAATKRPVTWSRFAWTGLAADMQSGRYDVIADGLTVRPERSILGRFTVPIARGGAILLLRRPPWAANAAGIGDLDRPALRIAVNRGAYLERVTRGLFRQATIQPIPDNQAVLAALANGDADAVMTNTFEAPRWSEGLAGVEPIGPLTRDVTALWVRDGQTDLAEKLDDWLLAEEASGRLGELRQRLLGPSGNVPTARPLDAILAATAERLSLMPFVAAAKGEVGREVTDVVQEATVLAIAFDATKAAAKKHDLPPPLEARTLEFFRAQIEVAKDVQRRTVSDARPPPFDLETQLRPAIARITARMAFLLVRLPRNLERAAVFERTREALLDSGVSEEKTARLAAALAALSFR
jgi:cyclohexadienyl dehydratase